MSKKRTFGENIKGAWGEISLKEKILLCLQSGLAIIIMALAILGMNRILPSGMVNQLDLILLVALLIVSAVRTYPHRKMTALIYMICCVFIIAMIGTGMLR